MSFFYIALPVSLVIAVLAVVAFVFLVRSGQYDDLETPPRRMLFDDVDTVQPLGNLDESVADNQGDPPIGT